ncbi:MAG: Hpt domain-containing protein [Marinicella sp.]
MFEELKRNTSPLLRRKSIVWNKRLEQKDVQVLATLVHQIAGSSGSYGLTELSDFCLIIEQKILNKEDYDSDIQPEINNLIKKLQQIHLRLNH